MKKILLALSFEAGQRPPVWHVCMCVEIFSSYNNDTALAAILDLRANENIPVNTDRNPWPYVCMMCVWEREKDEK